MRLRRRYCDLGARLRQLKDQLGLGQSCRHDMHFIVDVTNNRFLSRTLLYDIRLIRKVWLIFHLAEFYREYKISAELQAPRM